MEQAAEVLHVNRDKVYALIRTGQLRSLKIGRLRRISRHWIAEFTAQQARDRWGSGDSTARLPVRMPSQ